MWIAKNKIWAGDVKIFKHKPTRDERGYWEDKQCKSNDDRYGFIIPISDVKGYKVIKWEDEPMYCEIYVPYDTYEPNFPVLSENSGCYMRDSWYGD